MLVFPHIDPILLSIGPFNIAGKIIGPLQIHWYGMMYLLGVAGAWLLALRRSRRLAWYPVRPEQVEDLAIYVAFGVVLGGRIGYILFYNLGVFLHDPLVLFRIQQGGMSFHGGLLGVLVAVLLYCRKYQKHFFDITDAIAPLVPIGLGLGRLGNFINQELWGRPTDVPWAIVFPADIDKLARHPSQLYEFLLEGVVMFAVLYWYSRTPRPRYRISGWFLVLYATFRIGVEFLREPDAHIGYEWLGWMTRGQELSLPLLLLGIGLIVYSNRLSTTPAMKPSS